MVSGSEKYAYEFMLNKNKQKDPRVRGLIGIYFRHKKYPTYRVTIPLNLLDTFLIWVLYIKNKGHKSFNKWLLGYISSEIKRLEKEEDPEYLLAKNTYRDLKNKI